MHSTMTEKIHRKTVLQRARPQVERRAAAANEFRTPECAGERMQMKSRRKLPLQSK